MKKQYFGKTREEERIALLILEEEINRKLQEIKPEYRFIGKQPFENEIKIYVKLKSPREEKVFEISGIAEEEKKAREDEILNKLRIDERRIRRIYAINYRSSNEPYFVSIKSMTINLTYSEKALSMIAEKYKHRIEEFLNINLRSMEGYTATEETPLGTGEDTALNDYKIHTEIFIGGSKKQALYYID